MAEHTSTFEHSQEQWRPVVGYEGYYAVSNFGRVRRTGFGRCKPSGHILSQKISRGYFSVHLSVHQKKKSPAVHRLVAAAFIGKCPEGHCVNHKSGIKTDNRLENLEYVTPSENNYHAVRLGTFTAARGERAGQSILTEADVAEIRQMLRNGRSPTLISRHFSVTPGAIHNIKSGKNWKHSA